MPTISDAWIKSHFKAMDARERQSVVVPPRGDISVTATFNIKRQSLQNYLFIYVYVFPLINTNNTNL